MTKAKTSFCKNYLKKGDYLRKMLKFINNFKPNLCSYKKAVVAKYFVLQCKEFNISDFKSVLLFEVICFSAFQCFVLAKSVVLLLLAFGQLLLLINGAVSGGVLPFFYSFLFRFS